MRFAYADPPYPGMAHFYPEKTEVDHAALIERLMDEFRDGWALSTASTTLQHVIDRCPTGYRIGAWVKSFASFKPGVNPAYAWEPIVFFGGRERGREERTVRDWFVCPITIQKGLVGAKPIPVCNWICDLLGHRPEVDEMVDIFPGTGAMSEAVENRLRMAVGLGV